MNIEATPTALHRGDDSLLCVHLGGIELEVLQVKIADHRSDRTFRVPGATAS